MQSKTFPYRTTKPLRAVGESTARKWLRIDTNVTDDDTEIVLACIDSAVGYFEQFTGLQLMQADYGWNTDVFPSSIDRMINVSDVVVKYKQKDDANYTVFDAAKYEFLRTGEWSNTLTYKGIETIKPVSVQVTFKAGFTSIADIPAEWLLPIRALISSHFDERGDTLGDRMRMSERIMRNFTIPAIA